MNEPLGIVSCVWRRPERLRYTLTQLARQTCQDFRLYLINNNVELRKLVDAMVGETDTTGEVLHNPENRGPYARIELMRERWNEHDYWMWLDDDVNFNETLVEQWMDQADPDAVRGWQGFRFTGNYWQRQVMEPGKSCHYLWGSNLLIPKLVGACDGILQLDRRYWQCDDLWLCYYANHVLGYDLRRADIDISINVDGKDTYMSQHDTKLECLETLRTKGWQA